MLTRQPENDSMIPGCFACHVDCATGCHTDDQPFDHPYAYHPPTFEEDTAGVTRDEEEEELRSPKSSYDPQQENSNLDTGGDSTRGPEQEGSAVMRFVLWVLDVKTDTGT